MKRTIGVFLFFTATVSLAGACASRGSDVDSESHFVCGEDGDCKGVHGRNICVSGRCEFPGTGQTKLNELPGPAVDCTTEWPPTTLRFDTAETDAYQTSGFSTNPRLNRNGTVVIAVTENIPGGSSGYLIRWAGDTVSRFQQPAAGPMSPGAVSCDGMTMAGSTASSVGYRWSADNGFSQLTGANGGMAPSEGSFRVMAMSSDGMTTWGTFQSFGSQLSVAIRWNGDGGEALFNLPDGGYASPGWSGDASVFTGHTDSDLFVQNADAPPTYLEAPLEVRTGSPTAVSFDGSVIAGTFRETSGGGQTTERSYLWSSRNQLEHLPEASSVNAVTPRGVAVGGMEWPEGAWDYDLVWDRRHGARKLREVLATHGLQLPADTMIDFCTDISADGRVITGLASDAKGATIFRAILPAGAFD